MAGSETKWLNVPKRYGKPLASIMGRKVIRWCMDRDGNKLGTLMVGYDGSPEDARAKAKELTDSGDRLYPEISHIQTQNGATDQCGKPKFEISPNFNFVYDVREQKQAG